MAIIPNVTVNFRLSPRVITIPSAETGVIVSDMQDTLLSLEDEEVDGMLFPHLRNTSGGEDLGGGVSVGFTMELQNAVIAPAPRTTSVTNGTVTTANTVGITLIDSSATFVTTGVTAGATIINFTDKSVSSVISVDSETQITLYALSDGTDNQWGSGDVYKIWNQSQFEITGGNMVAVNTSGTPISPIRSTFGNEVLKTSSSSATTQEQIDIQFSSFNGGVTVDTTNGTAGTTFPTGTPRQPVKNIPDALAIATARGFNKIFIVGNITLDTGDNVSSFIVRGEDSDHTIITVNTGAVTVNTKFIECTLQGTLDGGSVVDCSHIGALAFVDGTIDNCRFDDTITLSGGNDLHAINCFSGIIGAGTPIINMGGTGSGLALRGYNGGIKLINKTGTDSVSMDMNSGQIIIDSTVTGGTIIARGIAKLTDNSGAGATVNKTDLINPTNIADTNWNHGRALTKGSFLALK